MSNFASISDEFYNRELSWLNFNSRVLFQAQSKRHPLLERLRFLSIYTSNLDEFYMKRVGGLKKQIDSGVSILSADGLTPEEQLHAIRKEIIKDTKKQRKIFSSLKKELEENDIFLLNWEDLSIEEKSRMREYFETRIFPILTPLTVDPGHPFPFISNLSTSLGVKLKLKKSKDDEGIFSRIKIPTFIPRWIPLDQKNKHSFISIIQIMKNNLDVLYPGMKIEGTLLFRLTRSASLEKDDEDAEDLLDLISETLRERKFAEPVRLEVLEGGDPWILNYLKDDLELDDEDIYEVESPIDFTTLEVIYGLKLPLLKYKPWRPVVPKSVLNTTIFELLKHESLLVHHPYESFKYTVEKFIKEAAYDPKVKAIKITLYRTGDKSPIVDALIHAAESGKQVVCLVELKARFDEHRNIKWAHELEKVGVHVVYGVVGLKTHSKIALVIRDEGQENKLYAHIGTGNYHSVTANFYTDFGLFTSDEGLTKELVFLFNHLTGRAQVENYKKLLVAPVNMRQRFIELIEYEISLKVAGKPSLIMAKMNSLEDKEIIRKLYEASLAGVKVKLFVRGFCALKAGVKNLSENIEVYSIVGRFLEHSRVYYFSTGNKKVTDGSFYIGSADWMERNLNGRVEVITPIYEKGHKVILEAMFDFMILDKANSWKMLSDGSYQKPSKSSELEVKGSQENLQEFYMLKHLND